MVCLPAIPSNFKPHKKETHFRASFFFFELSQLIEPHHQRHGHDAPEHGQRVDGARRFRVLTRSEAERECAFIRSFGAFARMAFTTAVSEAPAGFGFLIDVTRTE